MAQPKSKLTIPVPFILWLNRLLSFAMLFLISWSDLRVYYNATRRGYTINYRNTSGLLYDCICYIHVIKLFIEQVILQVRGYKTLEHTEMSPFLPNCCITWYSLIYQRSLLPLFCNFRTNLLSYIRQITFLVGKSREAMMIYHTGNRSICNL